MLEDVACENCGGSEFVVGGDYVCVACGCVAGVVMLGCTSYKSNFDVQGNAYHDAPLQESYHGGTHIEDAVVSRAVESNRRTNSAPYRRATVIYHFHINHASSMEKSSCLHVLHMCFPVRSIHLNAWDALSNNLNSRALRLHSALHCACANCTIFNNIGGGNTNSIML